jgi:medium-chain acyl-[acyl-carrier-protein] hydrolase
MRRGDDCPVVPRSRWLTPLNTVACPRAVVVCLPFGGASASAYRSWAARVPADVHLCAVDLPGRAARFGEPLLTDAEEIVAGLLGLPDLPVPFVLFGHSVGALMAYEWASSLQQTGRPAPVHLVVSGRAAPQTMRSRAPIHGLGDEQFLAEVCRYQGLPDEVLAHRELIDLFLPILRADFTITETYRHAPRPALRTPLLILGGEHDPMVAPAELSHWLALTTAPSRIETFPGGHFYLDQHRDALVDRLVSLLPR